MTFRTVRGSAEKEFSGEDGNILIILTLVMMITAGIGYYLVATDKVDAEIRGFGATQEISALKNDLQETIRKTLKGTNSQCGPAIIGALAKFKNFLTPQAQAQYSIDLTDFSAAENLKVHCFVHPESYPTAVLKSLTVRFYRVGVPNYVSLSSTVAVDVKLVIQSNGRASSQKMVLRYRIEALTLNHYGVIFDSDATTKIFDIVSPETKLRIHGGMLVDVRPGTPRSGVFPLSVLLPENPESLYVGRKAIVAAESFSLDEASERFLKGEIPASFGGKLQLKDVYKYGVELGALRTLTGKAPYQEKTATEWNDVFNYEFLMTDSYPLPKLKASAVSAIPLSGDIAYTFNMDKDKNPFSVSAYKNSGNVTTAEIYKKMYGDKNQLFQSCSPGDIGSSKYPFFVFNNFNDDTDPEFSVGDLVIDFSGNTDVGTTPPVFCGAIAARNVTFILNNNPETKHQFFGKLIVKGKIRVEGKGQLELNDISDTTNDSILYTLPNVEEVQLQYFNQRFYATQNFLLPFFRLGTIYGSTPDLIYGRDRYYVPRSVKSLFVKDVTYIKNPPPNQMTGVGDGIVDCKNAAGTEFFCRSDGVVSPTPPENLITRWGNPATNDDLLYEVFIAE